MVCGPQNGFMNHPGWGLRLGDYFMGSITAAMRREHAHVAKMESGRLICALAKGQRRLASTHCD